MLGEKMKKLAISTILVLVVALVFATAAGAITWGEPDDGEHPFVGTLLFVQNGIGYYSCSGTLLSPTVMLTAGHCVEEFGNVNDVTYVRFEEDAMSNYDDYASTQEWLNNEWILAETVIPHPQYDDFAEFPYSYDIGLVLLSEPVVMSEYGALPEPDFLAGLKAQEKSGFVSVGYGMQSNLPSSYQDDYMRYKGTVRLLEVKSFLTAKGDASVRFSNNPGIGGGTCFGDSGGPTFFKDSNIVVSVTSFGITGHCIGMDFNYRTDIPDSLDFINAYMP
jgi:hypothetical protein